MEKKSTLADLCHDLLLLGYQIGIGRAQLPDYHSLRQRVEQQLASFEGTAQKHGYRAADVDEAKYALCAFLDEMIRHSRWPDEQTWSTNPLQAVYFREGHAGVNFFEHLKRVLRQPEVSEVHYYCILFGFRGKYRNQPQHPELAQMVEDLHSVLRGGGTLLAPHGKRPDDGGGEGRQVPMVLIGGAALVTAVIVAAVLFLLLKMDLTDVVEQLNRMGQRA